MSLFSQETSKDTRKRQEAQQRIKTIETFAKRIGAKLEKKSVDGVKVWLIRLPSVKEPVADEDLRRYTEEFERISHDKRPAGNCRVYSAGAVRKRITTGMLLGENTTGFISHSTHGIGEDETAHGVVGVDWSAREIDRYQGNYHLLMIQARDQRELLLACQSLYGGDWWEASPEEANNIYKVAYFDSQEELFDLVRRSRGEQ